MNTSLKIEQRRFRPRTDDPSPFPESGRVVYARNPLDHVICQLRFPPILKIGAETPAEFQERIRKEYPLYREVPSVSLSAGLPAEISNIFGGLPIPFAKAHEFLSEDQAWVVTLTQESLALTCTKYQRWEAFRGHLELPLNVLTELYGPPFFTRIGLRYRDVIDREALGLGTVRWDDLLSRDLVSEFHSTIAPSIENLTHQIVLSLQGGAARVTVQHGLAKKNEQTCYIIDSDFYVADRTEARDAIDILNYFNRQAGRLFSCFIAERLRRAMGPTPI